MQKSREKKELFPLGFSIRYAGFSLFFRTDQNIPAETGEESGKMVEVLEDSAPPKQRFESLLKYAENRMNFNGKKIVPSLNSLTKAARN